MSCRRPLTLILLASDRRDGGNASPSPHSHVPNPVDGVLLSNLLARLEP